MTDHVLTKHKKSTYDAKFAANKEYSIDNSVTAQVKPYHYGEAQSLTATQTFIKKESVFHPPVGTFDTSKSSGPNRYDLDEIKNGGTSTITYTVTENVHPYEWTLEGDASDHTNYDKKNVTYILTDKKLNVKDGAVLTDGDYYLSELDLDVKITDASFDTTEKKFTPTTGAFGEDEHIYVYAQDGTTQLADICNGTVTSSYTANLTINYQNHAVLDLSGIPDTANVTGFVVKTTNKHYYTEIKATPHFTIKGSSSLLEKIGYNSAADELNQIYITNTAEGSITSEDGTAVYSNSTKSATDTIIGDSRTSSIKKSMIIGQNDEFAKLYRITWLAEAYENAVIAETGSTVRVNQSSGIFFDLLPKGAHVDKDSVIVNANGEPLPTSSYELSVTSNYNNTGRDLLKIAILESGDIYTVYFDTILTWEDLQDYGYSAGEDNSVYNPIAYETGNADIGGGSPDDGGSQAGVNYYGKTSYADFSGLDGNTADKKFIYACGRARVNVVMSAITALDKKVRASTDAEFSAATSVEPGGSYTYKLRYANIATNKSRKMIMYDYFERCQIQS